MPEQADIAGLLAAFKRHTQDTRLLRLTTPLGEDLLAECVRGDEAISRGYVLRIDALCLDAHLPLKRLLGQPALLQLLTAGAGVLRPFHGHITAAEIAGANGGFARYVLTIEPWTRLLAFGRDSRVFEKLLGQGSVAAAAADEFRLSDTRPPYRNRIDALPASIPYRSSGLDEHGRILHPRPTVRGQQSAIVVDPPGATIHTDRDHRIKIQFHWQRGAASHSRLDHPHPEGHTGAPGDDRAGAWVRVATPWAGANWGSSMPVA